MRIKVVLAASRFGGLSVPFSCGAFRRTRGDGARAV